MFAALVVAASLAACSATIPLDERSRGKIAHDLAISADSIRTQQRCAVSRYDGHASAPAFECVYIATSEYAAVLDFDTDVHQFKQVLRISKQTDAIAFATHGSIIGTVGEIQVRHGAQTYILDFVNGGMGEIGHVQDLSDAYAQLRAMGVPEFEAMPYIKREIRPSGGVIFIPVPAGRH